MSEAVQALRLARQSGVHVKADGADLVLDAAAPPPEIVLDALRQHKAEIVDLLVRSRSDRPAVDAALDGTKSRVAVPDWDAETTGLIQWFLTSTPPADPFELSRGVSILRPDTYWQYLKADIARGPKRARGYTGALQDDLRRLHRLFGPGPTRSRG